MPVTHKSHTTPARPSIALAEEASNWLANLSEVVENEVQAPVSSDFGQLLRRYRMAAGLSQEALAERARMSVNGISALERGYRRTPQFETLALLIGALALSEEQRKDFVAAAARSPTIRKETLVTVGPWPNGEIATLPIPLTSFVGREAELAEIAAIMREHRLVTLIGAGGCGKTRVASQVAMALRDAGGNRLCFVGLAPIGDPSLVASAIASALGVQDVPHRTLLETLVAYLKSRSLLLILDNCEHVIEQTAIAAEALLRGCPRLRLLATSREPFRAAGEHAYRLPSLSDNDAIALFADRASAVDHRFALTRENEVVVEQICRQLDGMPLAIELAAARVNVMSLSALAAQLNDKLQILSCGERTAMPRQQAMRTAIDWSYDLLSALEQRVFERLSAFAGGCTIPTARGVCADDVIPDDRVFELMASLVSKSLLVAQLEGVEPRYRMFELFREYARHKLDARGEVTLIAHRHAVAYLDLAENYNRTRHEHDRLSSIENPRDEIDNWRAAVEWALNERADILLGQRLVAELVSSWGGLAWVLSDARRWVVTALELINEQTPRILVARLWRADAEIAWHLDNHKRQLASSEKAIAHYREAGDQRGLISAQRLEANALYDLGWPAEAQTVLKETLITARAIGSFRALAGILRELACSCICTREFAAARAYLVEALHLLDEAHDDGERAWTMLDLANLLFAEGNPESAVQRVAETLAMGAPDGSRIVIAALNDMSTYLIALDRYDDAQTCACEALALARDAQLDVWGAHALQHLAALEVLRRNTGAYTKSARILGFVDARLEAMGSTMDDDLKAERDRALATLDDAIGEDAVANLIAEGTVMSEDQAVEEALTT